MYHISNPVSNQSSNQSKWQTVVILTLALWLGGSLILDLVIMPGMYASGMMEQSGFAAAGYSIFEAFNHIEVLSAAIILTGLLAIHHRASQLVPRSRWAIALASLLLAITLIYLYGLTPEMSALGLNLNLFESSPSVPSAMGLMHGSYWVLEICKLALGAVILGLNYPTPQMR
ncbi:MAG: DUF4149 domain-containing protein [Elainellaceae cyanobacterium]